jgi:hypothetical protein
MQDATIGNWVWESHLSVEHLNSMRDLNHRFLDLTQARDCSLGTKVAHLSAAQRAAAASCPYALFDVRFGDDAHWQGCLAAGAQCGVADGPGVDEATRDFVRLALFYAWHVASSTAIAAHLLLGMHATTAAALRRVTVDRLPALVATEAAHLTARWSDCPAYWTALLDAAARADAKALRRVQLSGLQLAAAAHLHAT